MAFFCRGQGTVTGPMGGALGWLELRFSVRRSDSLSRLRVSFAVKRHHGHGNSYKGKHLTRTGLHFRYFIIIMAGNMMVYRQT